MFNMKNLSKMKNVKVIMTLMMSLITMSCFGQNSADSVYIVKETDDMSGKTHMSANRSFIVSNNASNTSDLKGFNIGYYILDNMPNGCLVLRMTGIGNCNENDEIIILFENGQRISKGSFASFNCKGDAYFEFSKSDMDILRKQPMSKIRVTNGRSHDSYTGDVEVKDKRYFIQLFYALDNMLISEKK